MKKVMMALLAGFISLTFAGAYAAEMGKGDEMKSDTGKAKSEKGMAKKGEATSKDAMSKDDGKKKGKGKSDDSSTK